MKFPHASQSFKRANPHLFGAAGLPASQPQCSTGVPLVNTGEGKAAGGPRFAILFTIFATRPNDWDNVRTKDLQDCLIQAGILSDDNWRVLEGRVRVEKARCQKEERTEIYIVKTSNQP